jgi:hypothetical protein
MSVKGALATQIGGRRAFYLTFLTTERDAV